MARNGHVAFDARDSVRRPVGGIAPCGGDGAGPGCSDGVDGERVGDGLRHAGRVGDRDGERIVAGGRGGEDGAGEQAAGRERQAGREAAGSHYEAGVDAAAAGHGELLRIRDADLEQGQGRRADRQHRIDEDRASHGAGVAQRIGGGDGDAVVAAGGAGRDGAAEHAGGRERKTRGELAAGDGEAEPRVTAARRRERRLVSAVVQPVGQIGRADLDGRIDREVERLGDVVAGGVGHDEGDGRRAGVRIERQRAAQRAVRRQRQAGG